MDIFLDRCWTSSVHHPIECKKCPHPRHRLSLTNIDNMYTQKAVGVIERNFNDHVAINHIGL